MRRLAYARLPGAGAGGTGAPFRGTCPTCPPCSRLDQDVEGIGVKSTGGLLDGGRFVLRRLGLDQGQRSRRPLSRFVGCVAVLVCARAL